MSDCIELPELPHDFFSCPACGRLDCGSEFFSCGLIIDAVFVETPDSEGFKLIPGALDRFRVGLIPPIKHFTSGVL